MVSDFVTRSARTGRQARALSFDSILGLPGTEWLVEGILPVRGLAVLSGGEGLGKTFIALDLALTVASGGRFAGHPTLGRSALYVAAEGVDTLPQRLEAWSLAHSGTRPSGFFALPHAVDLRDPASVNGVIREALALPEPVRLVVIDTLSRCMPGADENSSKDMSAAVAGLDSIRERTGATVLVLHHPLKSDRSAYRGHGSLAGAADTMLSLTDSKSRLTLACVKQKAAAKFAPLAVSLVPVGRSLVPEYAVSARQETTARQSLNVSERRALSALQSAGESGLTAKGCMAASGLSESTFFRVASRLTDLGHVEHEGRHYRLTPTPIETSEGR